MAVRIARGWRGRRHGRRVGRGTLRWRDRTNGRATFVTMGEDVPMRAVTAWRLTGGGYEGRLGRVLTERSGS